MTEKPLLMFPLPSAVDREKEKRGFAVSSYHYPDFSKQKDRLTPQFQSMYDRFVTLHRACPVECHLLPVQQLQAAWQEHGEKWRKEYWSITAKNKYNGMYWETISCCVPVNVLFKAIGQCLRIEFERFDYEGEV